MNLLMISGDRSILLGKKGAFWYTLEELCKHWERIDVICPWSGERLAVSDKLFGNVFFHPSSHGLWYQPFWIMKKGRELISKYHHSVMTVHEYPPFYNGIGAWQLSRKTGVPSVLEIHHIVGYPKQSSFTEYIGYILSRIYFPWAIQNHTAVRVVNGSTKRVLLSWSPASPKLKIAPSFYLDAEILRPDLRISKKYDLVFCARLVVNKGLMEVIDALSLISSARLLVIGDGPLRQAAEEKAKKLGLCDRIDFVGWLQEQVDVVHAIQSAKLCIMNSRSEGGPRSALESMACGLPVIATPVGVMPDVIKEDMNGVFTSGEPKDIALKAQKILHDPDSLKRMGEEATKITQKFERKKLIKDYADFLKSACR
jgi:glycosyltransferase involved in cell wall biosynthesis